MSILIKGIDMPEKHHMDGYYISDDGRVFDISRKNVVGKAIQYQKEQYNKLEQKKGKWLLSDEQRREDTDNGNYLYFCSNCLRSDVHAKTQEVPYCWWCGADMRGDAHE